MPIYTYECEAGHQFDDLVGTLQNYPEPEKCPYCKQPIHKLVAAPLKAIIAYGDNFDEVSALKNKKWLENDPDVKSGARAMITPKNIPDRFQPKFS